MSLNLTSSSIKQKNNIIPFKSNSVSLNRNNSFAQVFDALDSFHNRFGTKDNDQPATIGRTLDDLASHLKNKIDSLSNKMDSMVYFDSMTDCLNARAYNRDRVDFFIDSCRTNSPLGIISFDIDNFGNYNNQHGHDKGDEALKAFANIVREAISKEDNCFFYRKGGEEFMMLLPNKTIDEIKNISEKIRKAVQDKTLELKNSNKLPEEFTISIGYADYIPDFSKTKSIIQTNQKRLQGNPQAKKDFKDIFDQTFANMEKRSDEALYISKLIKAKNSITSEDELNDTKNNLVLQIGRTISAELRKYSSQITTTIISRLKANGTHYTHDELEKHLEDSLSELLRDNSTLVAHEIATAIKLPENLE